MKKLEIQLGLNSIQYIKEKSCYNNNYYKIEPYGDWCCFFNGNDVIEEVCHEDEDYYTFTLGHFNNEEFVGVLQWDGDYGKNLFDYVKE